MKLDLFLFIARIAKKGKSKFSRWFSISIFLSGEVEILGIGFWLIIFSLFDLLKWNYRAERFNEFLIRFAISDTRDFGKVFHVKFWCCDLIFLSHKYWSFIKICVLGIYKVHKLLAFKLFRIYHIGKSRIMLHNSSNLFFGTFNRIFQFHRKNFIFDSP